MRGWRRSGSGKGGVRGRLGAKEGMIRRNNEAEEEEEEEDVGY